MEGGSLSERNAVLLRIPERLKEGTAIGDTVV